MHRAEKSIGASKLLSPSSPRMQRTGNKQDPAVEPCGHGHITVDVIGCTTARFTQLQPRRRQITRVSPYPPLTCVYLITIL